MYADDTQVYGYCRPTAVTALSLNITDCVEACYVLDEIQQASTESRQDWSRVVTSVALYCWPLFRCSWSHWYIPDWTVGVLCWSAFRFTWCTNFTRFWTRRHGWSAVWEPAAIHMMHPSSLHWLRVTCRIQYKPAVLQYKVLHGDAPCYLGPLVHVDGLHGHQTLRSTSSNRLVAPPVKLSTVDSRAFAVAAPQIWNELRDDFISADSLLTFRRLFLFISIILSGRHLLTLLLITLSVVLGVAVPLRPL